ncbi:MULTISPECIES: AraC family transcriptional regulator [unclassified Agarivorans]|uniref:AraC family transcriptional regulator n=1 Tax=unclassified Agarivorans TaxID=2636026 RepID=UPI0026E1FAD6|nr:MULTISPECIES: helix-turn-helix domain-containing protein [unclassified Agarivorans]MDO6684433.1 helix-turn-helix domain-containing protein [Agarivorans sp. 3_MG-2023]MDO6714598.1 helix-turn-helix domain-containing protein [Agarivorans sp. 2_MG-2023]
MSLNTELNRQSRINDVLYHIHQTISEPQSATELAKIAAYSRFHFHRCFKQLTGENVNDYIRRTRLERCANILIFSPGLTVQDAALQCGFQSPASFSQAFKKHFGRSPKQWRDGGYDDYSRNNYQQSWSEELQQRMQHAKQLSLPTVTIQRLAPQTVAYVRHQGYGRSIRQAYEKLQMWADNQGLEWHQNRLLGLYHSNPDIVPAPLCHYVACLAVDVPVLRRGPVSCLTIPGGMHATLNLSGQYGELLPMLHKFYVEWLPDSGYRLGDIPAFVRYQRCQFIDKDELFDLQLCVPISL